MNRVLILIALLLPSVTNGGSLGVYGKQWEIGESDLLASFQNKAADYERDGRAEKIKKEMKDKTRWRIENPKPVAGIKTTVEARKYLYDPSFVVEKSVTDHRGNIIVAAGTTISPLKYSPLTKPLLLIDARDKRQVEFAENYTKSEPRTKLILVAGSWADLTRKYKRQVFFDQAGRIVKKFQIKQVPAIIKQSGEVLEIEEVAL